MISLSFTIYKLYLFQEYSLIVRRGFWKISLGFEISPIFCHQLSQTRLFSETVANEAIEMTGKGDNSDMRYRNFDFGYRRANACFAAEHSRTQNPNSN